MMCSPMDEDELTQVGPLDVRVLNRRKRFFLFFFLLKDFWRQPDSLTGHSQSDTKAKGPS